MAKIPAAHPLSQIIYEGVLEMPPWKTLLKCLEDFMQVPSATLVLRRPQTQDPGLTLYLYPESDTGALRAFQSRGYQDSPFAELPEKRCLHSTNGFRERSWSRRISVPICRITPLPT